MSRNHLPEGWPDVIPADFVRTLERELTEAKTHFKQADEERHQQSDMIVELVAERDCAQAVLEEESEIRSEICAERDQLRARVAELEADKARHLTILKEAHEKIQTYAKRQGKTRMAGKSFGDGTKRNPQVGQHYPAIQSLIGSINTAIDAAKGQP